MNHELPELDIQRAKFIGESILPLVEERIRLGLLSLKVVHSATNKLVKQGDRRLNECLGEPEVLRTYVLAAITELTELLQELDWKPWREREKPVDRDKVAEEFADVLAFIGVIITILVEHGISVTQLTEAYIRKEHINVQRFLQASEKKQG